VSSAWLQVRVKKSLEGWIIEDVWIDKYEGWEPHIQAFKHENGDLSLRICYYLKKEDGSKTFVPLPCFIFDHTINDFREEVEKCKCDVIRMMLRKYVEKF
jgi:hypothetical protein